MTCFLIGCLLASAGMYGLISNLNMLFNVVLHFTGILFIVLSDRKTRVSKKENKLLTFQ